MEDYIIKDEISNINKFQSILYKIKMIWKIIRINNFVLIEFNFNKNYTDLKLNINRFKISTDGMIETLKNITNTVEVNTEYKKLMEKLNKSDK